MFTPGLCRPSSTFRSKLHNAFGSTNVTQDMTDACLKMEMTSVHLKLTAVSKSFGARKVVDSLDLEVRRGEVFCVLGPSGCGKTTLLRMVAGLDTPDSGSIEIAGALVVEDGQPKLSAQSRKMGFVFQDLALWPHLSVAGNLNFVLGNKPMSKSARIARVEEILALVHLSGFERAYPETL